MKIESLIIPDVLLIKPDVIHDHRGFFVESFHQEKYKQVLGADVHFVQDNFSHSVQGVVRGLHYQIGRPQAKLIRVSQGEVFDVAVDLRRSSPTFGQWCGVHLSSENQYQLWIPEGFAHGFQVISSVADVQYKTSDYWHPEGERILQWNDPDVGIEWPLAKNAILSSKDRRGCELNTAEKP